MNSPADTWRALSRPNIEQMQEIAEPKGKAHIDSLKKILPQYGWTVKDYFYEQGLSGLYELIRHGDKSI